VFYRFLSMISFIQPMAIQTVCSFCVRKSVSMILIMSTMFPDYRGVIGDISCKITDTVI